jgi:hypothetical protein
MSIRFLIADCQNLSRKAFMPLLNSDLDFAAAMEGEPIALQHWRRE